MPDKITVILFLVCISFASPLRAQALSAASEVPNVFTPNGDLQNDRIDFSYLNLTEMIVTIYSRWGQVVFETSRSNTSWDGKDQKGIDCEEGTYYYSFHYADFINKTIDRKGFIQLLR